jgi:hypothetical protein
MLTTLHGEEHMPEYKPKYNPKPNYKSKGGSGSTVATPIVDKNGKQTTVHKATETFTSPDRISKLNSVIASRSNDYLREGNRAVLTTLIDDTKLLFDGDSPRAITFEVGDEGQSVITTVVDASAGEVYADYADGESEGVAALAHALDHVELGKALATGLVEDNDDGTYTFDFSTVDFEESVPRW